MLSTVVLPPAWQDRIALLAQATPEVEQMEQDRRMLRAKEQRLKKLFVRGDITEKDYRRQRRQFVRDSRRLKTDLTRVDQETRRMLTDFKSLWQRLTRTERKRVAQVVIKAVHVRGERVECIEFNRPFDALFKP
jgi:hypothetical protein